MNTIRKEFVKEFGENTARLIEACALEHSNGINNNDKGDDPFKWAILMCIGYECMSKPEYRKYHGFDIKWREVKRWIKDNARLGEHKGDLDYLALYAGAYNQYM